MTVIDTSAIVDFLLGVGVAEQVQELQKLIDELRDRKRKRNPTKR